MNAYFLGTFVSFVNGVFPQWCNFCVRGLNFGLCIQRCHIWKCPSMDNSSKIGPLQMITIALYIVPQNLLDLTFKSLTSPQNSWMGHLTKIIWERPPEQYSFSWYGCCHWRYSWCWNCCGWWNTWRWKKLLVESLFYEYMKALMDWLCLENGNCRWNGCLMDHDEKCWRPGCSRTLILGWCCLCKPGLGGLPCAHQSSCGRNCTIAPSPCSKKNFEDVLNIVYFFSFEFIPSNLLEYCLLRRWRWVE